MINVRFMGCTYDVEDAAATRLGLSHGEEITPHQYAALVRLRGDEIRHSAGQCRRDYAETPEAMRMAGRVAVGMISLGVFIAACAFFWWLVVA